MAWKSASVYVMDYQFRVWESECDVATNDKGWLIARIHKTPFLVYPDGTVKDPTGFYKEWHPKNETTHDEFLKKLGYVPATV